MSFTTVVYNGDLSSGWAPYCDCTSSSGGGRSNGDTKDFGICLDLVIIRGNVDTCNTKASSKSERIGTILELYHGCGVKIER